MHRPQRRSRRPVPAPPRPASMQLAVERMEPRQVCAVAIGLANDTGASRTDRITADSTIAVNRSVAPGERVEYTVNGGPAQTATLIDGRRFVPVGMDADGVYRVGARIVDAAGGLSPPAGLLTITLDRTAAPVTVSLVQDTGVSSTDSITAIAALAVRGQERGARVQFSRDTGGFDPRTAAWGAYRPQVGANMWWVRQVDAAGNASAPVAISFTFDTSSDTARGLEGPRSGAYEAVAGAEVSWTVEFAQPMHVRMLNGTLPALTFTFRGRELLARYREGSGTTRLTYAYRFSEADAGTGLLTAPVKICLCYGGTITDAAGNKMRKHPLPPPTVPG